MIRYQLSIKGENLPRFCFLKPSPYAVVTVSGGPHEGTEIGRTETILKANERKINLNKFLQTNDSYTFFKNINDLIFTKPTLTNVNDFRAILILP